MSTPKSTHSQILGILRGALAIAAVLALSGCATRVRTVILPPTPLAERLPAQLLTCRGRPVPGALERQSDVARYVVDLDASGADCRSKLAAVAEIVRKDGKQEETHER